MRRSGIFTLPFFHAHATQVAPASHHRSEPRGTICHFAGSAQTAANVHVRLMTTTMRSVGAHGRARDEIWRDADADDDDMLFTVRLMVPVDISRACVFIAQARTHARSAVVVNKRCTARAMRRHVAGPAEPPRLVSRRVEAPPRRLSRPSHGSSQAVTSSQHASPQSSCLYRPSCNMAFTYQREHVGIIPHAMPRRFAAAPGGDIDILRVCGVGRCGRGAADTPRVDAVAAAYESADRCAGLPRHAMRPSSSPFHHRPDIGAMADRGHGAPSRHAVEVSSKSIIATYFFWGCWQRRRRRLRAQSAHVCQLALYVFACLRHTAHNTAAIDFQTSPFH